MAILVHGKEQALALRNMLAKEHLGGSGTPANPDDFNNVFDAFKNVAAKNGLPKDKGPIIGHLVKHRVYEDIDSHDSGGLRSLIFINDGYSMKFSLCRGMRTERRRSTQLG